MSFCFHLRFFFQYIGCCKFFNLYIIVNFPVFPYNWFIVLSLSCVWLQLHGLQHTRLPCPPYLPELLNVMSIESAMPSNLSSSVIPFSSCPQSFPESRSFPKSLLFASSGQSIGTSASVLPMSIQGWFPLGLTGLISLRSKGLSRVFFSTTVWKHQFFGNLWDNIKCTNICIIGVLGEERKDLRKYLKKYSWKLS